VSQDRPERSSRSQTLTNIPDSSVQDELQHFDGRTYVFLNQWGGWAFDEAMVNVRDAWPDKEKAFAPSE
ncbi:hypothetical protein ACUJ46_05950, partial [Sandaracinobacteroides sp. A072]|uniref:hypothetical protein n=1 Tax=Sandaracinobacteroides sp. A072 TaxID=3461146 RepID=UPI0040438D2F